MAHLYSRTYRSAHPTRMLACVAVALVLLIAVVRLWPEPRNDRGTTIFHAADHEAVALEDILPTRQAASERPPPPPLPPIAVEDPPELEFDDILDFDVTLPELPGPPSDGRDLIGEEASNASTASPARPVRFVEPEYTRDARRRNIRAQIVVEVTVDERGRVVDQRILERYLAGDGTASMQAVPQIGFGLEESALAAAGRFLFRPAQFRGEPVRSQYQLRFSFGV